MFQRVFIKILDLRNNADIIILKRLEVINTNYKILYSYYYTYKALKVQLINSLFINK